MWVGINSDTDPQKPDDIFRFQIKTITGEGDCDLLLNPLEAMDLCTGLNFVMSKTLEKIPRGKFRAYKKGTSCA